MPMAAALGLLAILAACGGKDPAGSRSRAQGAAAAAPAPAAGDCAGAYREYARAWTVWFNAELDDPETSQVVTEEFIKELPSRSALDDMRVAAEELRFEPGFDFWFVALTATARAIDACGEGAPAPRGSSQRRSRRAPAGDPA